MDLEAVVVSGGRDGCWWGAVAQRPQGSVRADVHFPSGSGSASLSRAAGVRQRGYLWSALQGLIYLHSFRRLIREQTKTSGQSLVLEADGFAFALKSISNCDYLAKIFTFPYAFLIHYTIEHWKLYVNWKKLIICRIRYFPAFSVNAKTQRKIEITDKNECVKFLCSAYLFYFVLLHLC